MTADPGPQSEMLDAALSGMSVEERAEWAASNFQFWADQVGAAEDELAEPEPEPEPVAAVEPVPEPVALLEPPPPGFSAEDGEWVTEWRDA